MADNGCTLWFIDLLLGIFRNKRIKKYNRRARGISKRKNAFWGDLFPPYTFKENIIVSGGNQSERLQICEAVLCNAYNTNHSVIILHTANGALENIVTQNGLGTVVSSRNRVFDAFTSFEFNEIFQVVTETCKAKYDIKPSGRYVLQVVYDLLVNRGRKPYFSGFANCPFFKLGDQILTRQGNGLISQDTADKLNSLLLMGQSECPKIDTYFNDMKAQTAYLSAPDPANANAISVLSAIKNNQIVSIDVRASTNTMFMELIVNSLIVAMNRGYDFSLMIDDIAFVNNDMLKNTVCQKANHHNIIFSKDLYALTGGKEDIFAAIVGEAEKTVLFAHGSSISCEKWSKYIGEYDKIDISYNQNAGWNQSNRKGWGYNTNGGRSETVKREAKVKPEQINQLSQNEAFIYDHTTNELIHAAIS